MNNKLSIIIYTLKEDYGLNFVDIARKIGNGTCAQDVSRLWIHAKEAKENFDKKEKIVYRKRINVKKPKKSIDIKEKACKMDSQMALAFQQAIVKK